MINKINVIENPVEAHPKILNEAELLRVQMKLQQNLREKIVIFFENEVARDIVFLRLYNKIETFVYDLVDSCDDLVDNETYSIVKNLLSSSQDFCYNFQNRIIFPTLLNNNPNFDTN